MTRHARLKALVRARMRKTGENYTTARRHLVEQRPTSAEAPPATAPPGRHADSAALTRVLASRGLPHSEALLFGLGGGAGFLSFVFEYAGHPPMYTAVMRRWSMSHQFAERALGRSGLTLEVDRTGSPKAARKAFDAALSTGEAFACIADLALLPHHGLPASYTGMAPVVVGVYGRDDGAIEIEDHGRRLIDPETLLTARGGYRKAKHALYRVQGPVDRAALLAGVRAALADSAEGLLDPQMGHFHNNFGIRGMHTLATLLGDTRTKKGLPRRFDGHRARLLGRLFESVRLDYSGPQALRGLQADFLAEAQALTGLSLPVDACREAGLRWAEFADACLAGDPGLAALRSAIEARTAALRGGAGAEAAVAHRARVEAALDADLGWSEARWHQRLAELSGRLPAIIELETHAAEGVRAQL